ncbi:alcohol-forming fatty acyl-CoA reductase-like [Silene latifolia]|uniref:alcohol-forming fatty acyl-CoA reductase-like n=1 Tax=Silene latifolia TaxID=37657 RepID=UPI003D76CD53
MDFDKTAEFLGNKTILVTGATGFIAKILVEKILRIQPNVGKLYLLVRAKDSESANVRIQDEVIGKELFRILKETWRDNFESFISEKIAPVAGDTSSENLGVVDDHLKMQMFKDVDIVINVAATTKFDERYDVALGVNTMGPLHVVNFAKKCVNIKLLIHVSTAYVCGEKTGLISETPYSMGETLNGVLGLDIDNEKKLVDQLLNNLKTRELSEKAIRQILKDFGKQRAELYGWPNTYVFTKAMGEMLVGKFRGNLPVVTMRPTIVCSTYKEPFPGWVEGCRTLDSVAVIYGKGHLSMFLADGTSVFDLIPADMFVNSMIVAMKAHVNQAGMRIYQVGCSYRNPVTFNELREFHFNYFTKNPWSNNKGNAVEVRKLLVLSNIVIFKVILILWIFLVGKVLNLANCIGSRDIQQVFANTHKKLKIIMKLVELYRPYVFFKGIFVDSNTENLRMIARENGLDEDVFNFDPMSINWKDFFINVHIPAIVKYLF